MLSLIVRPGMPFPKVDNELLGITELSDEQLKKVIEGVMAN